MAPIAGIGGKLIAIFSNQGQDCRMPVSKLLVCISAILLSVTTSCKQTQPQLTDEQIQRIRAALPGMTAQCFERVRMGGVEAFPSRVDQCFEMTPQRRWRGVWTDYFEVQQFCQAPARRCVFDQHTPRVWLSFADGVDPTGATPTERAYTVDFIGRRTLRPGHHGHFGVFAHEILVDRLISISPMRGDPIETPHGE